MALLRSVWMAPSLAALAACATLTADDPSQEVGAGSSTGADLEVTTGPAPSPGTSPDAITSGETGEPPDETTSGPDVTPPPPPPPCAGYKQEGACALDSNCRWTGVLQYIRGGQGCEGDVVEVCVDRAEGPTSTWYRGGGGDDEQVLQFDHTPADLPPEWRPCDCDGPIACFCAYGVPACPERLHEFCGGAISELACDTSAIGGALRCAWFRVYPEGPPDDQCSQQPFHEGCLPAEQPGADMCVKVTPPYPQCSSPGAPVFYREVDGTVEVTASCGPIPPATEWTPCAAEDTPGQPDECGCLCL